jgi:MFS family permease
LGVALGVIVGAYLGQSNLALPWLLTSIIYFLLSLVFIILFKKYSEENNMPVKKSMFRLASEGIKLGLSNKGIMSISLLSAFLALSMQSLNMYWSIYLKDEHFLEIKYMGYIFVAIVAFNYTGSQLAGRWQKRFSNSKAIVFPLLITALSILLACLVSSFNSFLGFFLLHEMGRGIFKPLSRAYINRLIDDKYRSTILSLDSMIVKIGAGLGLLSSGIIANSYSIVVSWLASAVFLIIIVLYYLLKNPLQKGVFLCYSNYSIILFA